MKENIALKKPKQHMKVIAVIYIQYWEIQSKVAEWHIVHPGGLFYTILISEGF